MENQINIRDQNNQQAEQNPTNHSKAPPWKSKFNYWMASTIVLGFLLIGVAIWTFIYSQKLCLHQPENWKPPIGYSTPAITTATPLQQNNIVIDKIYIHKAGNASQLLDQSSPNYQKIKSITIKIINSTLILPIERREKITLVVQFDELLRGLEQSDYIEIKSDRFIRDDIEDVEYDKVLFILRSKSYTGIFGHNAKYKGKANDAWWPWWGPSDVNLFWSLGEFLGVPSPTPQPPDHSARRNQAISDNIPPTENQAIILAELQRLGIETKDRWEQSELNLPSDLSGTNWGLKKKICEEGGYDLTVYAGKSLLSTSYLTNEIWDNKESLLVWILSDGNKIACVYKSVLPGSNLTPGIFSVKENPNIRKK